MTSAQLPENYAGSEEQELISLIPRMRSYARYLCRDATEAEDLTQAAFARAWRRRDSYLPGTNMKAWILRIVRNQFFSDKRRSWRVTQLDPEVAEQTLVAVFDPSAALELEDVRRAMQELSDEQRQALQLITIVGLPYQEAADISGCAVGTIKSRVNRGRQALAAILAEDDLTAEIRPASLAMAAIIADAARARLPGPPNAGSQPRYEPAEIEFSLAA